jgi:hypothetical protein
MAAAFDSLSAFRPCAIVQWGRGINAADHASVGETTFGFSKNNFLPPFAVDF